MPRATHLEEIMPRRPPQRGKPEDAPLAAASHAVDESASYDRFKLLADCMPELVFYVDANEVCRAHNAAVEATLGLRGNEVDGRPLRDILGEASYECVRTFVARALRGEEARLRQVHRDRDGRLLDFDARYVPHRRADDAVVGFCALLTPARADEDPWLRSVAASGAPSVGKEEPGAGTSAQGSADSPRVAGDSAARERALAQFRAALQADRFCLFHQPIVPIGGVAGEQAPRGEAHEVLLRLRNEEGRLIHPGAFLARAEEIGFMRELDRWVVERVWRWCNDEKRGGAPLRLHVNLFADTVCDESFHRLVRNLLASGKARPDALCFEIGEDILLEHRLNALSCAHGLRMLGCRTALDRFRGASGSYSVMLDIPVDFVKIDGSLIAGVVKDTQCATKVKIITTLARSMGASTIAERVEDVETREVLARIGVDFVQGFGVAIPESLADL